MIRTIIATVPYMNPSSTENIGSIGPGFLNQVPTLTVLKLLYTYESARNPCSIFFQTLMPYARSPSANLYDTTLDRRNPREETSDEPPSPNVLLEMLLGGPGDLVSGL